jgi:hypothetical protein
MRSVRPMKKALALAILLSLPVVVFLFLKFFGSNNYEVPVYELAERDDCVESQLKIQGENSTGSDEFVRKVSNSDAQYVIWALVDQKVLASLEIHLMHLSRIYDTFQNDGDVRILSIISSEIEDGIIDNYLRSRENHISGDLQWYLGMISQRGQYSNLLNCKLGIDNTNASNLFLFDDAGRLRGYYNSIDDDETERLILELKILKDSDSSLQ